MKRFLLRATIGASICLSGACSDENDDQSSATATGSGGSGSSTVSSTTGVGGGTGGSGATGGATTSSSGTGGTGATGGSGAGPGCVGSKSPDYAACDGFTFYPNGACTDGACASTDLEKKVYAAWKARAMTVSGLSEQELAARVEIADVEETDGPTYVWVAVTYIVVLDLIRSRQVDSVNLGRYPLGAPPSDGQIANAVKLAMEAPEWTSLGAINAVACPEDIEAAFASCVDGMNIDFCHVDFANVTGLLGVNAMKEIDAAANQCKKARVDVTTAAIVTCMDTPCAIN